MARTKDYSFRGCYVTELRSVLIQPLPDLEAEGQVGRRDSTCLQWLLVWVTVKLETEHW